MESVNIPFGVTTSVPELATRVFTRPGQRVSQSTPIMVMMSDGYRHQLGALLNELAG